MSGVECFENLYEHHGARLFRRTDGYVFLVPVGNRLSRRYRTPRKACTQDREACPQAGIHSAKEHEIADRARPRAAAPPVHARCRRWACIVPSTMEHMKRWLVVALGCVLLGPVHGQELWANTRAGMAPDEVVAIVPNAYRAVGGPDFQAFDNCPA